MAGLDEFNLPAENLGADPAREFNQPSETYMPVQPEYVSPETPDGIPVRKKKTSKMLITAIMSLSLLGAPAVTETVRPASPPKPAVEITQPAEETQPPATLPPETQPPETEPPVPIGDVLTEVGTWLSEDGQIYVHFDAGSGWWCRADDGNLYGQLQWWEQEETVYYSGWAISTQSMVDSSGESYRTVAYDTVEGTITLEELVLGMGNPLGISCQTYVPAEAQRNPPQPVAELPNTAWQMAAFSTVPQDVAAAQMQEQYFLQYYVWISGVVFGEEGCTLTFTDSCGGSAEVELAYSREGAVVTLMPAGELEYLLTDAANNSETRYSYGAKPLTAYVSAGENGSVLCLQNPFANMMFGLNYEYFTME